MHRRVTIRWILALLLLGSLVGSAAAANPVLKVEVAAYQVPGRLSWYELPFSITAPEHALTALTLKVVTEVKALENQAQVLVPEELYFTGEDGVADPPTSVAPGESTTLKLRARLPGPGTYRIPVQVTARELEQPFIQTLLLRTSVVKLASETRTYLFTYENRPAVSLWGAATWLRKLAKAGLGTGTATDCSNPLLPFKSTSPEMGAEATYTATGFFDATHGRTLSSNAQFHLFLFDRKNSELPCQEAPTIEVPSGARLTQYAIDLRPADPTTRFLPGTYVGQLLINNGVGEESLTVTVHVRNGLGMALVIALLGIGLHFLMARLKRIASKEEFYPRLEAIRTRIRELHGKVDDAPLFLRKAAVWGGQGLNGTTPKEVLQREFALVEGMLGREELKVWFEGFTKVLKEDDAVWEMLRTDVMQKGDTTLDNVHAKMAALIKQYRGVDLMPPPNYEAFMESRSKNRSWRDWLTLIFPIAVLWGARILLFIGAVVAGLWAAVGFYLSRPGFGADPLADYGAIFMIGFVGTQVNAVLQLLTNGIAPQKS